MPGKKAVLGTMRTQGNSNSTRNVGLRRETTVHKCLTRRQEIWAQLWETSKKFTLMRMGGWGERVSEKKVNSYRMGTRTSWACLEIQTKLRQKPRTWRGSWCCRLCHCHCQLCILLSFLIIDKLMNPCIHVLIVHYLQFHKPTNNFQMLSVTCRMKHFKSSLKWRMESFISWCPSFPGCISLPHPHSFSPPLTKDLVGGIYIPAIVWSAHATKESWSLPHDNYLLTQKNPCNIAMINSTQVTKMTYFCFAGLCCVIWFFFNNCWLLGWVLNKLSVLRANGSQIKNLN